MLLLWAVAQVLVTVLVVAVIVEPVIRGCSASCPKAPGRRAAKPTGGHRRANEQRVVISDPEGRIEWVNQGFERLTGYPIAAVAAAAG